MGKNIIVVATFSRPLDISGLFSSCGNGGGGEKKRKRNESHKSKQATTRWPPVKRDIFFLSFNSIKIIQKCEHSPNKHECV